VQFAELHEAIARVGARDREPDDVLAGRRRGDGIEEIPAGIRHSGRPAVEHVDEVNPGVRGRLPAAAAAGDQPHHDAPDDDERRSGDEVAEVHGGALCLSRSDPWSPSRRSALRRARSFIARSAST
jgi:hypothetical protein